jgi:uncharacterized protein (TIGR02594 family)
MKAVSMTGQVQHDVFPIQQALVGHGFHLGTIDGLWGPDTEAALKRFQAAHGLVADGLAGPKTRQALFGTRPPANPLDHPSLVWMHAARRLIGLREDPSPASNPVLLDWADRLNVAFPSDATAWCGLFVAHCIATTLPDEPLPQQPLGARNWARFGVPCTAQPGAILIFWRGQRNGWQGHVGFYAGEEKGGVFHVLGGNQGDRVSVARIHADRLLATRWPATVPMVKLGRVVLSSVKAELSHDEA